MGHFSVGQAPRFIRRIGQDATIRTFTKSGTDEYNDPIWSSTDTTVKAVRSFGTSTRVPELIHSVSGEHRTMAFEFFVDSDDISVDIHPGEGKPPEVHFDGTRYKIIEKETFPIGITRFICESTKA